MEIKRIYDIEDFISLHVLKNKVFNIDMPINIEEDYWIRLFNDNKIISYCYCDDFNNPIAGIYVSNSLGYLYVEQLFVDEKYRDIGLQLGRCLLKDVLKRKEEIEEYFNKEFYWSCIAPIDEKSKSLYRKVGYHGSNLMDEMIKRI